MIVESFSTDAALLEIHSVIIFRVVIDDLIVNFACGYLSYFLIYLYSMLHVMYDLNTYTWLLLHNWVP